MIRLKGLCKQYRMGDQTVHALRDVDLAIERNELVAFIGASGSGKSTMMSIIGCLDRPSSGEFQLNGSDVARMDDDALARVRNREIGFIFQSFHLLPRMTALDNVAQPLVYRGIGPAARCELAARSLERVGLESRMHHRPNELSGGQRQRVAIARALVGSPALLLADEPTGNLDSATTRDILALIREVYEAGQTVVMVTHEPDIAAQCRRVVRLQDGRIVSDTGDGGNAGNGVASPA
ncbi:ABC transporter ATP-binding protein [Pseudoduganella sp. SL102]|uniref:ABC transporter ATP-binding protein n=1 Tax=Pseudoduganella sp. SL102 TaxID=2995154 RepID=UPI00248BFE79|nr:ABC transporter ATP-binding protein [Pseudoduganella sp. SL102]WBS00274.1 ABC transporter ATP-binding protein [Pseudoduganella sp. SL102]